ncbi:MAG: hypothetical protein IJS88_01890 [Alphaproteobacteria bacterium]|nr:hypothetical protein [Alphaproteobacteria bacterium]
MKKTYVIAAALALLASCRSVDYEDLNPTIQPNQNLLPVLKIETDTSMYQQSYTVETEYYDSDYDYDNDSDYKRRRSRLNSVKKRTYNDLRKKSAANLFIKEVQENIIEQTGEKKGYIRMRITYLNNDPNGFYSLTMLPLFIPTFLGVPCGNSKYTTEVEVTIMDKQRNIIKRYTDKATDEEFQAMYWGYSSYNVKYKASMVSLKKALENIRHQINNDAPEIRSKLK